MKKILAATFTAALLAATAASAADGEFKDHLAELPESMSGNATVGVTSDYRFRGISQTSRNPAVQGSMGVAHDSGVYVDVWGSSVDNGLNQSGVELDYTIGYAGEKTHNGRTYDYDIHYVYFDYPGNSVDTDFQEIGFSLGTSYTMADKYESHASIGYDYSDDYAGSLGSSHYTQLNHETSGLPGRLTLGLHGGYTKTHEDMFGSDNTYWDWSVGLSREIYDFDVEVAYVDTDIDKSFGKDTQDAVVLTVSKAFSF